jgi:hypothetical protein
MKLSNKYKYPKEINANLDTFKNPFQGLKQAREDLFKEKLEFIKSLTLNNKNIEKEQKNV